MKTRMLDWRHGAHHMWEHHSVTASEANDALDLDPIWFDPDPQEQVWSEHPGDRILRQPP